MQSLNQVAEERSDEEADYQPYQIAGEIPTMLDHYQTLLLERSQ